MFIHEYFLVTLTGIRASLLAHGKRHLRCEETTILVAVTRHTSWLTKRRLNNFIQEKHSQFY